MNILNELDEHHLAYWADHNPRPITMRAPVGMDTCSDCSAVATTDPDDDGLVIRVAWKPTPAELADLRRGGTIWLSTWGGLPPHMLEVQEPALPPRFSK